MVKLYKYVIPNTGKEGNVKFHIPEEIKDKQWTKAYKNAKKNAALPSASDSYDLEDSKFTRKLLTQPDQHQVYVSQDFTVEQIAKLLSEGNCYQIARELAKECLGDLIDGEDLRKFENELEVYVKDIKKDGCELAHLKNWLKVAKRPFLDALLVSLNADPDLIKTPSTTKKRKELAKRVKDDNYKVALLKYYYDKYEENQQYIEEAQNDVDEAKDEYYAAKEQLKDVKNGLEESLDTIVNCTIANLNDAQQKTVMGNRANIDRAKARKQRERIRYKGLLEFAQGVAAATIDGVAPQYISAAQEVGNQVMRASQNIIDTHPGLGVEAGSIEQTKLVVEGIVKPAKGLINTYANEDTLKVGKSLSQLDTSGVNVNGASQPVGANS